MALGLEEEAKQFHRALRQLGTAESDCGIGETAFQFWDRAIGVSNRSS